jgi:hypothetical protein
MTSAIPKIPTKATLRRFSEKVWSTHAMTLSRISAPLNHVTWQGIARHRRAIAITASVGLHALLLLSLIPQGKSGFSTGGQGGSYQGEGEGLNLDLMASALSDAQALEIRQPEPETLAALDTPERLDDLATPTEAEAITDVVPDMPSISQRELAQNATAQPAQASAARQGGEGEGGTSSGTFDELWAAIAPCWRRIADNETLPVNLTVTFAGNGMLAKPPEIVRLAEDASNAKALRSESLAITALSECGAYQMAAGRANVSVYFPAP